jgi:hypothetical protein
MIKVFKLETGMVVEFFDSDVGIVINDRVVTQDGFLEITDKSNKDMFDNVITNDSVNNVFKPSSCCRGSIDYLLDTDNYLPSDIIWRRKVNFDDGTVYCFTTEEAAKRYNNEPINHKADLVVDTMYLCINGNLKPIDNELLPYLDVEIVDIDG